MEKIIFPKKQLKMTTKENPIKIAQISDLHLTTSQHDCLHQINPYERAQAVITHLKQQEYNLIIISGDIAHNGELKSYKQLLSLIDDLQTKIILFPGNHDDLKNLQSILAHNKNRIISPDKPITIENWAFVYLDTIVKHEDYGHISNTALAKLKNTLSRVKKNVCLMMHHHPHKIGIPHVDKYKIKNSNNLSTALTTHVKLILHGHVHNNYFFFKKGAVYSSPLATSFQFNKNESINVKTFGFNEYTLNGNEIFCTPIFFEGQKNA